MHKHLFLFLRVILLMSGLLLIRISWAETPVIKIEIQNHLFSPSEITVPANTKIKLLVHNLDSTSEEFESYELNREKVIMGNQRTVIFIGPLPVGEYPFFGEFYPKTAQGLIIAR